MIRRFNRFRYAAGMIVLGLADVLEEAAAHILPRKGSTL